MPIWFDDVSPVRMKPAWAMLEYASIRLMSDWAIASTLPTITDAADAPPPQRAPLPRGALERPVQHPDQRQERRDLRGGRHERGHGRGGALIHVGRPLME